MAGEKFLKVLFLSSLLSLSQILVVLSLADKSLHLATPKLQVHHHHHSSYSYGGRSVSVSNVTEPKPGSGGVTDGWVPEEDPPLFNMEEWKDLGFCLAGEGLRAVVVYTIFLFHLLADLGTTIGFLVAVFRPPEVKRRLLYCNLFLWYNVFYPGLALYLIQILYVTAGIDRSRLYYPRYRCIENRFLVLYMTLAFLANPLWPILLAFVAKAFRNAVMRGNGMLPPGEVQMQVIQIPVPEQPQLTGNELTKK